MGQREVLTRIEELTADSEHVSVARHYHLGDRRTLTRADRSREDTDLVLSVRVTAHCDDPRLVALAEALVATIRSAGF